MLCRDGACPSRGHPRSTFEQEREGHGFTGCEKIVSYQGIVSFVSGYRFSDTVSPSKSNAPLGAGHRHSLFSASSLAADVAVLAPSEFCQHPSATSKLPPAVQSLR